jgi:hypothetical protein
LDIVQNNNDQLKSKQTENIHSQCNDIHQIGSGKIEEKDQSDNSKVVSTESVSSLPTPTPPPGIPPLRKTRKLNKERRKIRMIEWKKLPEHVK